MYNKASSDYASEVRIVADQLIENGEGAPWNVLEEAHQIVQRRRQRRRQKQELEVILGKFTKTAGHCPGCREIIPCGQKET